MPSPKPSTPPGTNSQGRTYEEQTAYEKEQKRKAMEKNEPGILQGILKNVLTPKGKTMTSKSPANMEMKKSALKKKAASKKKSLIPASPTH